MTAPKPLLRVKGVSKTYPGVRALQHVDVDFLSGEVHVLLGANGAGKSTLMKMIAGSEHPDEGVLEWNGKLYNPLSPAEARACGVAMIHQELSIVPTLTVAENICLGKEPTVLGVVQHARMVAQAQHALGLLGSDMDVYALAQDLTLSQWQLIEIARALHAQARMVIMDEPTSSLSQWEIEALFGVIKQLQKQDVCVLYITHKMQEIKKIANRITLLKDGCLLGTYGCDGLSVEDMLEKMSGKKVVFKKTSPFVHTSASVLQVHGVRTKGMPQAVSFHIKQGEVLGLTGLVGSGCTRFAKGLFGAEPLLEGHVVLDGCVLRGHTPRQSIEAGMGFVSEDRTSEGLVLQASVRENTTLAHLADFLTLGYLSKKREREESASVTQQLLLKTPSLEAAVKQLSGGNQQKVVLSKWLLGSSCKMLIFDEPTRGIDMAAKADIYTLIQTLVEQGKAVLLVSTDMAELLLLSNRIAVMHQGAWVAMLEGDKMTETHVLEASFATQAVSAMP
jgi:ribose transport system ATP-binding protein